MHDALPADVGKLTLTQTLAGMRDGVFSAEVLATRYLERIRSLEKRIHAWAWIDVQRVLAEARKADDERRVGRLRGPLHGVPIAVKDVIYTQGIPTRMGSPIFADFVPAESAACIDRLVQAGAYVQGKTVTTEFAARHPGPTANPWNLECTPGGSSSGSAAAVAAGFTPVALGTQTRGSVIRPAAYCGIVGFKPSFGLISRYGVHRLSETLDHVGVLARDIDDAGWLASMICAHDPRDPGSMPAGDLPARLGALSMPQRPPRLAAVRSPVWKLADGSQQALFTMNLDVLRGAGADIELLELPPIFTRAGEVARIIQLAEASRNFAALRQTSGDRMSTTFREWCEQGERITECEYRDMLGLRNTLRDEISNVFAGFDAIITPPATGEAPQTLESTGDAAFCSLWTLCGLPCVVFPTGVGPRSLPMGLQVVGDYFDDASMLEIAKWCARHLPFHSTPDL